MFEAPWWQFPKISFLFFGIAYLYLVEIFFRHLERKKLNTKRLEFFEGDFSDKLMPGRKLQWRKQMNTQKEDSQSRNTKREVTKIGCSTWNREKRLQIAHPWLIVNIESKLNRKPKEEDALIKEMDSPFAILSQLQV